MVWVSRVLLRQYGRFMDDLRIYVRGGSGGMGFPRLGGEGGKGGDVWLVAQEKLTLKKIKDRYPKKRFVAGTGSNSSIVALKGAKGKDCEVMVPTGISVVRDDGEVLGELNKAGERLLVARGGIGGCLATNFLPSKGQNQMIHLDLKLIADVGLVGFPNAGKSSLLTKISHATPQIADYAFTTIKPELGTIKYADFKQITVADLPGLIEGAHANKGRGHSFLKHVERTNQLLFVVDVSGFQLASTMPFRTAFETVILLAKELELYKEELRTKPAILAVNKMDLPNAQEKLDEFMEQLQNPCDYMQSLPTGMIPENPVKFKEIVPISTYSGEGIEKIIMCIRKVLDEEAEKKIEDYQRKQIHSLHLSESS
ncbi:GTP-binding protein 10 isoform X1 [Varanus komodoensis]|uniref:GTP-binding protein 10 n=1 Tax=Varanus komodoensis TaxID=61221 RepID=A0A8D2IZD0_VARKO|nr:GTP-binding protein 10 isoform X1 [Varanus komodoensis]